MGVDPGFERIKLTEKREFEDGNSMDQHYILAESRFHRMLAASNSPHVHAYKVDSVELVKNPKLWQSFEKKREEFRMAGLPSQPLLLFHGTRKENIDKIVQDNFNLDRVANGRKYGDGVYLSERPELSAIYSGGSDSILLCQVLLGRTTCGRLTQGFDSAEVKDCRDDRCYAVVIANAEQIFPTYIINYSKRSTIAQPRICQQTQPLPTIRLPPSPPLRHKVAGDYRKRHFEEFSAFSFGHAVERWDYRHFLRRMGMKQDLVEQVLQYDQVTVSESADKVNFFLSFKTGVGVGYKCVVENITIDKDFKEESFKNNILYSCRWTRTGDSDTTRLVKRCLPPLPWQLSYTVTLEFTVSALMMTCRLGQGTKLEFSCNIMYLKV